MRVCAALRRGKAYMPGLKGGSRMKHLQRIGKLVAVAFVCLGATHASAQREATGPTPPRVALVDGVVSFLRPGADDWTPAKTNTALAEGDELYVADRGNVELQIGS